MSKNNRPFITSHPRIDAVGVKKTTSLEPIVFAAGTFQPAQANSDANVADVLQLSGVDNYCHSGKVEFPGHPFTIGEWYYLDQASPGQFTSTKPSSGWVQQLFFVENDTCLHVDIEEAYSVDLASFVICLADDNERLALATPQPDTIYIVQDADNDGSNRHESWIYDITVNEWKELDTQTFSQIINTIAGNQIATHIDGAGNSVNIFETITNLTFDSSTNILTYTREDGTQAVLNLLDETVTTVSAFTFDQATCRLSFNYDKEDGSNDQYNLDLSALSSFQIVGCPPLPQGCLGEVGLQFQPSAVNVKSTPVTWSVDSFTGQVENLTIDANTGLLTYDIGDAIVDGGRGIVRVTATDANGVTTTQEFCLESRDPVDITPLACNGDMVANIPSLANKYVFNGLINGSMLYTDLAKTTLATDGDIVEAWEDGNGNGDVTLRTGDVGPEYQVGVAPNNNDALFFNGTNTALQYDVPTVPLPGSAFKLFFLVQLSAVGASINATVIASTQQANNNTTAAGTWQVSRGGAGVPDALVFRTTGSTIISGSQDNSGNGVDVILAPWSVATDGNWHLVYISYDGSIALGGTNTAIGFFDGQQQFEILLNDPPLAEHFKFFENRAGSDYVQGSLAELQFAGDSMTDAEATQVQAYYLCKFGLDASLITDPGPFAVNKNNFFETISQFELHILCDGTELVYDTINNIYYPTDDVPTPDLGLFRDVTVSAILNSVGGGGATQIQLANTAAPNMDRERVVRSETGQVFLQGGRATGLTTGETSPQFVNSEQIFFDTGSGVQTRPMELHISSHTLTFPEPFTSVPVVTLTPETNSGQDSTIMKVAIEAGSVTTTQFTILVFDMDSSTNVEINWIAIG